MKHTFLFLLVFLFLASCASPATPASTQTITPVPTLTQTATPTVAPTNTPTITPTKAPEVISPDNASRLVRYAILGHGDMTYTGPEAVVSPDHKTIAVVSPIGVILYDTETLEKIKIIETSQTAASISFSPDSTKLAIGLFFRKDEMTNLRSLEIWDVQTSTRLNRFEDVGGAVFSPDGCQLFNWNDTAYNICDNTTDEKSAKDWRNPSAVTSPDGTKALVYVIKDGWALWDIQNNIKVRDINIKASLDFDGKQYDGGLPIYSPDGKTIASYQADQIYLIDTIEFKQVAQYKINTVIKYLQYSPDSEFLLAFGKDSKFHLLSAATGEQLGESDILPYVPLAVTFSPDSKFVTSLDDYINIYKWEVPEMKLDKTYTEMPMRSPGAFSNDGKYLAIASSGHSRVSGMYFPSKIVVLDANTLEQIYLLEGGMNYIGGLTFSPNGNILASTESSTGDPYTGIVNLWDMTTGKLSRTIKALPFMQGVAFDHAGKIVAAVAPFENQLFLWDASSGELIDRFTPPFNGGSLHPSTIYFSAGDSQVVLNEQIIVNWKKKEQEGWLPGGINNNSKTLYVYDSGCVANNDWKNRPRGEFCVSTSNDFGNTTQGKVFTGKTYSLNGLGDYQDKFVFNPSGNILMQTSPLGFVLLWHINP